MRDWQKDLLPVALLALLQVFCPSCSFFFSTFRCFSTCFLACLASSIFSMPILTPHPDPPTTPDSATQAAIESMANLLFMLETVRLLA